MKKLILFDIDGTLVKGVSVDDKYSRTLSNLHDLEVKQDWDRQGLTDQIILARLLSDEGWDEQQIRQAMPKLIIELDRVHAQTFKPENLKVLPGVPELLEVLSKHPDVELGLITGNLETVSERKLAAFSLYQYFPVGGFGSDTHVTRADLVTVAIQKAGFVGREDSVYVIGDTARDIEAAKVAGIVHRIGVANGFGDPKTLAAADAEIVLENFKNTAAVLLVLGLN